MKASKNIFLQGNMQSNNNSKGIPYFFLRNNSEEAKIETSKDVQTRLPRHLLREEYPDGQIHPNKILAASASS